MSKLFPCHDSLYIPALVCRLPLLQQFDQAFEGDPVLIAQNRQLHGIPADPADPVNLSVAQAGNRLL